MALEGVLGGNGHIVEKTKATRFVARSMVTGRADGAKRVGQFTRNHRIGGSHRSTRRGQCGFPSEAVDVGVRVQVAVARAACGHVLRQLLGQTTQRRDVHAVVCQLDVSQRRLRRLHGGEAQIDTADQQAVLNGAEPLWALGVPLAHLVLHAQGVRVIAGFTHRVCLGSSASQLTM